MTTLTKLIDWTKKLAGARDALQELHGADAGLRGELADLEAERDRLFGLRPPKPDVLQALDVEITTLGAQWAVEYGTRLISALAGRVDVTASGEVRGIVRDVTLADELGGLTLAALCAIAPDLARAGLARVIELTTYDEGAPMAERAALLAAMDKRIATVVQGHAALVDTAAASGIALQHLPVTVGIRTRAAQAHAAWERDVAQNRAYYERNPAARPVEPAR